MTLKDSELKTLASICDTLVPSIKEHSREVEFYARSASQFGVDEALATIVESKLEPGRRLQFHQLLRILDSRLLGLTLNGSPRRFTELTSEGKEEYLRRWRDSGIPAKRVGFQAVKRLVLLLSYALTDQNGTNPNWRSIGYPGPQVTVHLKHSSDLEIKPLLPEKDLLVECEVCVIGAGAGGSVIASELSESGMDVLVIESGGYETAESFEQSELGMTDRIFVQHGFAATKDLAFILLAGRGGGGGTLVNWMTCLKPPSFVREEWEDEYGIDGVKGSEFEGFLDEVWSTLRINTAESQRNPTNDALWRGCEALKYNEGIDYEVIKRDAVGCDQRCAFCTYGCIYSCKQSTIMNYLPMAFKRGARFLFNTEVDHIVVGDGAAKGVEATHSTGGRNLKVSVRSKAVVVACGSMLTPALLLKSSIRGKNIGRNLRIHPTTAVIGTFQYETRPWDGPPQTVAVRKYLDLEGTRHGFWIEAVPTHPGFLAQAVPWANGRDHKEFMLDKFRRSAPEVVLVREWGYGSVGVDKYGSPLVEYALDERDKVNLVKGMKETAKILVAAGASEIMTLHVDPVSVGSGNEKISDSNLESFYDMVERRGIKHNRIFMGSAHLMGSCRMSADESEGATNPRGELYGVENLYIGDASVFPTPPGVNPMVTIMAMAKRTAEFIREGFRS